ncbi:MAG: polysaccharide pyruvyl transferase family protein [Bacteroidales bacterium]|nr:polysaccharide pyruvyl transferase family protein [Bacteroidales bacterium]
MTIINSWVDYRDGKIIRRNLGDDLNYYILRDLFHLNIRFKDSSFLSKIKRENYLCIGSIIHYGNRHSIVWGAGCISNNGPIPKLKQVLTVRGPLTRERLIKAGLSCPEIYGDPVLLLPILYKPTVNVSDQVGVILNAADETSEITASIRSGNHITYISMVDYTDWKNVVNSICECRIILSSSLHGLIIADAYNIPNIWVSVDNNQNIIGGDFKYLDYLASVKRKQNKPIDLKTMLETGIDKYDYLIEKPQIDLKQIVDSCPFKQNLKM